MAKITKATLKAFIRKNKNGLYINCLSRFDGMTDGVEYYKTPQFHPVHHSESMMENTLGIQGLWLVGGSRNSFDGYNQDGYIGIKISNCCGSSVLAIKE